MSVVVNGNASVYVRVKGYDKIGPIRENEQEMRGKAIKTAITDKDGNCRVQGTL